MKVYKTDSEIDQLEEELFGSSSCSHYTRTNRRNRTNYTEEDIFMPVLEDIHDFFSNLPGGHNYTMAMAAAVIDEGFRGSMGEEMLLSQDPWDFD